MATRLEDRLNAARLRGFVGRSAELELFRTAITTTEPSFYVLHIAGPGGIGKTTLLREFMAICAQHHVPAFALDARTIEPLPEVFLQALRLAMGLADDASPLRALTASHQRQVILIDTYEQITPLDDWLRNVFLPQLPEQVLTVLAGRHPPTLYWHTDPGWQPLTRIITLRNFNPDESRTYLNNSLVPPDQHQAVLTFTHGHPLALSLVVAVFAQRGSVCFRPDLDPDLIKTLLEQFVQKVPGPAHRAVLEVCALVRHTTEALLIEVLGMPDVHELFTWLRDLSFIEAGQHGLFPHDLVREALHADLRWRNPDWYAELRRRIRQYYGKRLQFTQGREQQRVLLDYIYLHRHNPLVQPFYTWQEISGMVTEIASNSDWPELLAMVQQYEGTESARIAAYWFQQQPQGVLIIRSSSDAKQIPRIAGFMQLIAIHQTNAADLDNDPALLAAWQYMIHHAPLRPNEQATLFRFWMARDTYQAVSPVQSLIFVHAVRHYLTTPGLAFSIFPCADPQFWAPVFTYADMKRLTAADFVVGDRHYGVYGYDWRVVPPLSWLALMAEREESPDIPAPTTTTRPSFLILHQPAFLAAVRAALHDLLRPDVLGGNALLRTRLVLERAGSEASEAARITTLQTLIRDACETLQASPRTMKAYRAVYHTYLQPAPTQEQAAELLDLPFSTFRRHLKMGVEQIGDLLWQWELQAAFHPKKLSLASSPYPTHDSDQQ